MNKKGFTLIELMVSMFVAMIVFGGVFAAFQNQKILFIRQEMIVKLNRDKRATVEILQNYLGKAGINTNNGADRDVAGLATGVEVVSSSIVPRDGDRIVFSSDENLSETIDESSSIITSERLTFLIDTVNGRKSLYLCPGAVTTVNANCSYILDNVTKFQIEACDSISVPRSCGIQARFITDVKFTFNAESEKNSVLGNNPITVGEDVVTTIILTNKMFGER